jgi:alpha-1,6-mannosyltransferase
MKICDIVQAYTDQSGGIRTYIRAKRDYIDQLGGLEHVLIIPGSEDSCQREGRLTTYTVKGPALPFSQPYRFTYRLNKVLSILREEQPQVIELGTGYILPWAAFLYRRHFQAAVVGYYHTDYPTAYAQTAGQKLLGRHGGRALRKAAEKYAQCIYGRCDATIVATEHFRQQLANLGVMNTRMIPLGVDTEIFNPMLRDRALWSQHGAQGDETILLFSGRLDHEKKVMDLVDAVRILPGDPPVKLVLIGDGPLKKELQDIAAVDHRLIILPYTSNRQELARLLASADIYVTAGPHETFGLSVLEAQSCGLPVVGVRAGALIERVPPSVGFLAEPGSPHELALALRRCLAAGPTAMGARARRQATCLYSWWHCLHQTFELYQSLTGFRAQSYPLPSSGSFTAGLQQS